MNHTNAQRMQRMRAHMKCTDTMSTSTRSARTMCSVMTSTSAAASAFFRLRPARGDVSSLMGLWNRSGTGEARAAAAVSARKARRFAAFTATCLLRRKVRRRFVAAALLRKRWSRPTQAARRDNNPESSASSRTVNGGRCLRASAGALDASWWPLPATEATRATEDSARAPSRLLLR